MAVISLVGVSRMFLDFHWLSDVFGGWIVGTALAVGFCAIWEWTQRYRGDVAISTTPPEMGSSRS
jgi:membrane-associated phospholipid phosphatase